MKNKTLKVLAAINRKIQISKGKNIYITRDFVSLQELMKINKVEIQFLVKKFSLKEKEALFLAGSCNFVINSNTPKFDVEGVCRTLADVDILEVVPYQSHFKSLVEKKIWVEIPKDDSSDGKDLESVVDILNKVFVLHSSFGKYLG